MKLTVIGYYGAYPEKNSATSGYLIEEGDTKILLDCGSGVLSRLQNYIDLKDLDGVVFSHYHPDHCADFGCLQYAIMLETLHKKRIKTFEAWGPGRETFLSYQNYCNGKSYLEKESFSIGSLNFQTIENPHEVPSFSIKVKGESGAQIVYSGDTNYYKELALFTGKADLFLCESSLFDEQQGVTWGHLTSTEAGKIAADAGAKKLCLTHFPHYPLEKIEILKNEAQQVFKEDILLAKEGLEIEV
ncbi:MAG: MBL fold metallo-hydrolase [Spirochaetales bacterium]|nr:MBL fold metallo-hydrolase [Spirochaetales bacterium]